LNKIYGFVAASILVAFIITPPVSAASLLGGLINTGADSGNSGDLVSNNSNGSIGVGGSDGASVNLGGLTGGLGDGGGLSGLSGGLSGGNVGAPGVADISTGTSSGGGTQAGVSLLGGGGTGLSTNPLGLLGSGGSGTLTLPGLGGSRGTPGTPGAPGSPGFPGGGGTNGISGFGGINGVNGFNGRNGIGVAIPANASSRLRSILAVLAQRDWIRMVDGRAICLANFGTAEVSSWLPQGDWAGLNAALPQYAQDISALRQLLANCRSSSQRQALNVRDLNRVIGIGVANNGTPVLYML
jgi:hypothetical protein